MKRHRVYWGLILMFLIQLGLIHFRSSAQGFNRWTYADPESILTTNFKVHFTLAGPDATTQQWADSVAVFAEQIRFIFTESMGWPTPPNDNGQGGDNRYDIYIFDVLGQRGAKGIVYQEANANPPGSYHFPSWLEVMKDSIPEPFLKFPRLFKLLAHELHHSFQKGMRAYDLNGQESEHLLAWVEHTSILIEDLVYPGFSTLQFRLEADSLNPLARPFVPLHDDGCRYTGALWTRFLTEKYGENVVQQIWQLFAEETDESLTWALTQVMDSYGGLSSALKEYSVWRYFTGSRATTGYFASASGYPTSSVANTVTQYPHSSDGLSNDLESLGGCLFVHLNGGSPGVRLTLTPSISSASRSYSVVVVGYSSGETPTRLREHHLNTTQSVVDSVPWNLRNVYDHLALIIASTNELPGVAPLNFQIQVQLMSSVSVTLANQSGTQQFYGSMLMGGLDTVVTGQPIKYLPGSALVVRTMNERFVSADTIRKHHDWLSNSTKYLLEDNFIAADGWTQYANYIRLTPGVLNSQLIEGSEFGQIGFRDPWYLHSNGTQPDSFFTYATPFSPTGAINQQSGGVFLNQSATPGLPYYSVRAAETQTVNGQPWVFWKWDTSGVQLTDMAAHDGQYYTTPAIFRPWGTRTVTATYKAHLASNGSDVMTAGGQRRLVAGPVSSNVDHLLVYGSAGSIWASYKTGSGAWGNEVCISGSGSNHAAPSVSWGETYQPVVWRSGSSGNYSILFNKRTSGSWLASPVSVASSLSSDPAPQIAFRTLSGSMTRRPHVAYRTSGTGLMMRWSTDGGSSWSDTSSFTDNNGIGAYSLSAVNTLDVYDAILTLGYVSNMRVYVRDFQGSWGSRVLVPASEGENRVGDGYEPTMTDNLSLQVVRDEGSDRTDVAFNQYQEYYNEQTQDWLTKYYQVVHTRNYQGTWGTATAYETSTFGTPSLSMVNGKFTMLWEDGGTLYKSQESQQTWPQEATSTGSGAEPALAVGSGTSTSSAHYAWRENASGLYKIVPSSSQMSRTVGPQQPAKRTSEGWVYRRVITMIDTVTGGIFSVTASLPSVAGRTIPLKAVNDTLPGINGMNFFSFMEPAPFTAESGDSLDYELTFATSRWPKDAGMVALQAGFGNDRPTQSLAEHSIDLTRKSQPLRLKVPLEASSGSPLRLAFSGSLPEWADRCIFTLTHVYAKPTKPESAAEPALPEAVVEAQSEALAVYPNPFNPETKVGYKMKEGGWVKVSVFDLLGREVAVLVDGWMPAGTHSAIWNARELPSGTYICRLTTQEAGQSVVRTVKMQYVR